MRAYLRLWRPSQWIKNLFVLAGAVFGQQLLTPEALQAAGLAVTAFCLAAGGIYALNDVRDAARDRLHPLKRLRPVASGEIAPGSAVLFGAVSLLAAVALALLLPPAFLAALAAYGGLMLGYSLRLKQLVVIDVMTIAAGFALRAFAGAAAVGVSCSHWLLLATFLLALFIALAKRLSEVRQLAQPDAHRPVLAQYSPALLDRMLAVVAAAVIVVYALYTVADETQAHFGNDHLKYTLVFVLYGLFRYFYLLERGQGGAPEQAVLTDRPLQMALVLWGVVVLAVVYGGL
ncbi:MAG TPA: decaprenyl-phosphate phosphoribosyltransferase [bacterium]|nr:decaprenyl-phosphate phosphoribosyltransferase [bacterium]